MAVKKTAKKYKVFEKTSELTASLVGSPSTSSIIPSTSGTSKSSLALLHPQGMPAPHWHPFTVSVRGRLG